MFNEQIRAKRAVGVCILILQSATLASPARAQEALTPSLDMVLDGQALLLPADASYDRSINGLAFQDAPLVSRNGYQYAVWYAYDGKPNEHVYIARRDLNTDTWIPFDTGREMTNGDDTWDAHNVISLGISGDGRLHLAYDMHSDDLKYFNSDPGVALNPEAGPWDRSIFNANQDWLVSPGKTLTRVTYPEYSLAPNGDLVMTYRVGGSGNGDVYLTTYRVDTKTWDPPHQILNRYGTYTDLFGTSTSRNGYLNALDVDSSGVIHITWTWREASMNGVRGGNHDILYAYSEDGGDTWKNNEGKVVGTVNSPIKLGSPGTVVVPISRTNSLGNQQGQVVDLDGRVHVLVFHRRDDEGHEWEPGDGTVYDSEDSAHYHYVRDPVTREWNRSRLPVTRKVGSRPSIGYDRHGNVFAAYISPGAGDTGGEESEGDLIIAKATKAAAYADWKIIYTDSRDFISEPFIDQDRLVKDDVLSLFIQEYSGRTGVSGSPLHVLEFEIAGHNSGDDPELSISDFQAREGDIGSTTFNFSVALTSSNHKGVEVSYATRPGTADADDFTPVSGTFEIPAGSTRKTISVPVGGDTSFEPDETFTVVLSEVVGATVINDEAEGLILNDDDGAGFVQFTDAGYSVSESAGAATITLSRTGGSSGAASVRFATGDASAFAGSDYNALGQTVSWADGETGSRSVTVKIGNDTLDETNEIVALTLSSAEGASLGARSTAELTIIDDDNTASARGTVQFSGGNYSVDGANPSATITLTRTGGSNGAASVRIDTFNGTAVAGEDFVDLHQTVVWADGDDGSKVVNVSLIADTVDEPNETASLVLSSPIGVSLGGTANATLTIIDDDVISNPLAGTVQFSTGAYSVRESGGYVAITVTRLGGSEGAASATVVTESDTASSDADYGAIQRVLSWNAGDSTTRTLIVPIVEDGLAEGTETFRVSLTDARGVGLGGPATSSIDIFDNDQSAGQDNTPDPFNFKDRAGVQPGTYVVSNVIKVSGLSPGGAAVLKIVRQSGGNASFSVNFGPFTNVSTTVRNGDEIRVRNRIPDGDGTARVTMAIGSVTDSWTVSTQD